MAIPQTVNNAQSETITSVEDTLIKIPFQNLLKMFEAAISITAAQSITDESGTVTPDGKNWYFKGLATSWDNSQKSVTKLTLAENSTGTEVLQEISLTEDNPFIFNILTNELSYSYDEEGVGTHTLVFTFYGELLLNTNVLVKFGAITE